MKDLQFNIKRRQLADDTSLFLKDENNINSASNVIEEFYSFSGLKLNSHKTKLMKIGRHIQDDIDTPFEVVDKIKILSGFLLLFWGVVVLLLLFCFVFCFFVFVCVFCFVFVLFLNGKRAIDIDENWTDRTEKLTRIIQLWSKRDLSIMGKIVTVKCFFGESANLYYAINRPSRKSPYRCQHCFASLYGRRDFQIEKRLKR